MSKSVKAFDVKVFRRLLFFAKKYRWQFTVSVIVAILISIVASVKPLLLQYIINHHFTSSNQQGILYGVVAMLFILVLEVIFQVVFIYLVNWLGQHIIRDIRVQLHKHIIHFKMAYFDTSAIGKLTTRLVSDTESIAQFFGQGLFMIISDLLKMLVVMVVMLWVNPKLSLITFGVLPLLIYATRIFQKSVKKSFQEVRTQVANLNSFVQERISGMRIVQLFNREKIEYQRFTEINEKHKSAHVKTVWYYSIFFPIAEILSSIAIGLVVWYGGNDIIKSGVTQPGDIIAFIMMAQMLFRPLRQIADKFNTLQMGMVTGNRVFQVLDTKSEIIRQGNLQAPHFKGNVSFNGVNFGYNDEKQILHDVSFAINQGETVAFVGATGAGKSTIIKLINRFYEIGSGSIYIDSHKIEDYELTSLRQQIAVVLQDVFLYADSIYNNITLGDDTITLEQVEEAAKNIGVHDFIKELPNGYHYNVKERGAMLSAGQRQLIAFLRAYISNPSILILDEATASIDSHSEQLIQKATDAITRNQTSIIIAHRLTTVQKADRIIVMDKGRIVEQGTHHQLLKEGIYYKKLYEKQFLDVETPNL